MKQASATPIENSYRIPTGIGFAGQYPGDLTDAESHKKISAILDAGIKVFIDLTEPGELARGLALRPYDELLRDEAARRGIKVEYIRLPVPDQGVPSPSRMREILEALEYADHCGRLVYLHCWGGKGRTGTAVACHLISRGTKAEEALRVVQKLAHTMPRAVGVRVPENDRQCRFVRDWNARTE